MAHWQASDIPDQTGRVAIVTGANSGLGYATAFELARHGARVVIACRDESRGRAAVDRITAELPSAALDLRTLDLADLVSVRTFADAIQASYPAVDLLVNNAGVMATPRWSTIDGFEMQLGTNHLGHFALTGLLLPLLVDQPGARVVTVSSVAHRLGGLDFDDLMHERSYQRWKAYGDSKLANLLFALELHRRLDPTPSPLISVAAHPGTAATNLFVPSANGSRLKARLYTGAAKVFAQSEAKGALPQLYAATAPHVLGGDYFGPSGPGQTRGYPRRVSASSAAKQPETAARLWALSEDLTGVRYDDALGR